LKFLAIAKNVKNLRGYFFPHPVYKRKSKSVAIEGAHPALKTFEQLSGRGLDQIKIAYNPRQPDGRLRLLAGAFNRPMHRPIHLSTFIIYDSLCCYLFTL